MSLPIPYDEAERDVVQRVDLKPRDASDPPNRWRKFLDDLRAIIGAKSLYLCERLAEAKIRAQEVQVETIEVENEIKLLKARQEYEEVMARRRQSELEAAAKADKEKALADQVRARTQALETVTRSAAKALDGRKMSRDEARIWLAAVVQQIEVHGGSVDIDISNTSSKVKTESNSQHEVIAKGS